MRSLTVLAAAAAVFAASGCGGAAKPKPETAPAASTAASTAAPSAKPAASATVSVSVKNFDFAPRTLTVKAGTKVTWKNRDATNHTVTFSGSGAPASVDNLAQGASVSRTFKHAGTYSYVCTFHPNMKAKVVVSK